MRLLSLHVRDFRNLAAVELLPSPRATILVGDNGQGKTNLLEAVYLLTTLKPLRASRLQELVRFGAAAAEVAGDFDGPGGVRRVAVQVGEGGRTALLDGKPLGSSGRLDDYFEGLACVCFSPDDLLLVKAGPDGRRRFVDRAAFNRWPAVLGEAREYVRALRARNAALRAGMGEVEESFRGPLVRAGARLLVRRMALVAELAPRVQAAFAEISGPGAPEVRFAYRPAHGLRLDGDEAALAAALSELLAARLERDREKGFTTAGPHADELTLALDGKGAKLFGSQGQQRALVLALKIAEIENLRAALGRPPLLLLDDVSSELDPAKNRYLLAYLGGLSAQAFLTTTDRRLLDPAAGPDTAFYKVENGVVSALV
ncbi:DNA replication/repair protein RecF [Anaeromyxobacter oryzisoli]|uniref:DNA replication/repair protein RecF n=1 Tax=Anaeromyxobacter oryzisoli TaxID=2925408 RepID=UPI001F59D7B2|nr:DNA replication/repair protein RecF [Anaeromyxobacter sp. SG63]